MLASVKGNIELTMSQLLQVFDSWAGELSPHHFELFSKPTLEYISKAVRQQLSAANVDMVPIILFAKGANMSLASLKDAGYDVLGLDWCIEPSVARAIIGDGIALQGNVDPNILYGGKAAIRQEILRMCQSFMAGKPCRAWIANLGHGITPGVDPEDLKFLLQCVQEYSGSR